LAALIDGSIVVNLGHIPPVVLWEGFKPSSKHGEGGGIPGGCEEEPPGKPSGHFVLPPDFRGGIEVSDNGEIKEGVPIHIAGHSSSIHALDPLGQLSYPIMAGEADIDLPSVLDVPTWQVDEWLLCNGWMGHC
jgi:hypothetical protein